VARIIAFSCFVCAAFAWVPPWVDRVGLAALGFGFLAWSIGRGLRLPFALLQQPAPPALLSHPERIEPVTRDLQARIGEYLTE